MRLLAFVSLFALLAAAVPTAELNERDIGDCCLMGTCADDHCPGAGL